MGSDAKGIDLFASGDVPISTRPFLLGQVVDNNGQQIANQVIASNFATYLIQNKLQTRRLQNGNTVQFVGDLHDCKPRWSACTKIYSISP